MLVLKYLLTILGIGLFGSAVALVAYDVFLSLQLGRLLRKKSEGEAEALRPEGRPSLRVRWQRALPLALAGAVPVLLALSIVIVPDGFAGVRVSQFSGALPGTLYTGVHLVAPLVESVVLYDTRERVYRTVGDEAEKKNGDVLTVQAREGMNIGLAVTVRYRLDARRLDSIHTNLPEPVDEQVVGPVVASAYRQLAPNYVTREIFATKREELRTEAANAITKRLGEDGILVREVLLRDIVLPEEYSKGLEGLLLKEQENERLGTETEIKQKQVKIAELEAEAQKTRDVKNAEAQAATRVLQAKAEADSMQYTLPLKQKQIEQSKLEAEARKEATLQNAEAAAQAKIIDSRAEVERQKNLTDAEANRIRVTAAADTDRMRLEASVLKNNPQVLQKIIAERISDKLQIIMVPTDGKNFLVNDLMRSAFSQATGREDDPGDGPVATTQPGPRSASTQQPRK